MPQDLTYEGFTKIVGQSVLLDSEDFGPVTVEVVEAEQARGERPDQAFSVLFKGPTDPLLDQQMYQMDLGPLGSHPLFLVPVMEESDGYVYEAVFTRLAKD